MEELFERIDRILTEAGYEKTVDEEKGIVSYKYVATEDPSQE